MSRNKRTRGRAKRFKETKTIKTSKKAKRMNNYKNFNINNLFIIFFVLVFIFSVYQIIMWYKDIKFSEKQHEELVKEVVAISNVTKDNELLKEEVLQEEIEIDFEKLLDINSDVVAWIMIPGTNINYPVLQSYDNNYYLKRDINKNIAKSGSIYLDYRNNAFNGKNSVLYGHNMKNGTMFAELKRIYNEELGKNIEIKIFTPESEKTYKVFSVYTVKPEDFNINTTFKDALENTKFDFEVDKDEENKILTLFTCTDSLAQRIIVHGVLVENVD